MLLWGPQGDAMSGGGGVDERGTFLKVEVKGQSQDRQSCKQDHGFTAFSTPCCRGGGQANSILTVIRYLHNKFRDTAYPYKKAARLLEEAGHPRKGERAQPSPNGDHSRVQLEKWQKMPPSCEYPALDVPRWSSVSRVAQR